MRVLILGGTTEANALAAWLARDARFDPIFSLAGRTKTPTLPGIRSRIGGFGGPERLADYLRGEAIDVLIDATHPFAEQISAHAVTAASATKTPLAVFGRGAWVPSPGDRWRDFPNAQAAARGLGKNSRRVFLTLGRLQLAAFEAAPEHDYLVRTIDTPDPMPNLPHHRLLLARGPFSFDEELKLMRDARIEVLVSKNSGGSATRAKLDAARVLGIDVMLISRSKNTNTSTFETIEDVFIFLEQQLHRLSS